MEPLGELQLPESRWADVAGPVHYREWTGPVDGPVFLCLHGLGGSNLNWALVAPGLASRGRVLAVDLAGFGLTPTAGRGSGVGELEASERVPARVGSAASRPGGQLDGRDDLDDPGRALA